MGDRISMSISVDSPLDKTFNRGPLAQLLRRQYGFPFGINVFERFWPQAPKATSTVAHECIVDPR